MESKFNFKSQMATDRNQSERLLALGLNKETADMTIHIKNDGDWYVTAEPFYEWEDDMNTLPRLEETEQILPAWSLGRLIKLMPRNIIVHFPTEEESDTPIGIDLYAQDILSRDDSIAEAVSIIEWLIKDKYFNNKYLV